MPTTPPLRLAVDIGGTFTDAVVMDDADRVLRSSKTLTTHDDPAAGALDGALRAIAGIGRDPSSVAGFIHGTTLATNALIERRGARLATITTEGFRDILEIAYERRHSQYDIDLEKSDFLVPRERAFTIRERLSAAGDVLIELDETAIDPLIDALDACGAEAVGICLLHAYANPDHERRLRERLLAARPALAISLSSEVSAEAREFDRLCTTVANAYIQPLMSGYLDTFARRFATAGITCPILVMTAGGGMTTLATAARLPIRLVESGPAGGAILAARVAAENGLDEVLSFDMGGTTAKLCLIDAARPQTSRRFEIGRAARFVKGSGMPVRIPVIDMIEIGAGGGSIAELDRLGRLGVGPRSAGSEPGPVAFGRGGTEPTVSDADIALGYIRPESFAEGRFRIDVDAATVALERGVGTALGLDADGAADGVSRIVDESMASAARLHAVESGKDLGARTMIAFGGNGPLHACRVARSAGVSRILVPADPGVGSAVGFLFAPVSFEIVRSRHSRLRALDLDAVNALLDALAAEALAVVRQGVPPDAARPDAEITTRRSAFMRYDGQGHEIEIALPERALRADDVAPLIDAFERAYARQFSRPVPGMSIEILNWAVRVATHAAPPSHTVAECGTRDIAPHETREIVCDVTGVRRAAAVVARADLVPGDRLAGPALVVEPQTTTFVAADFGARVDARGNLVLTRERPASDIATGDRSAVAAGGVSSERSAARLQVMWNRLLATVEEQGQILIRAAFSPIVRECGDISAGVFDAHGRMLAQAVTGTPGHINTMAAAVRTLCARFAPETMHPGDIYVTNDPWLASGHLNDFLLMMPVFVGRRIVGFTACTSHLIDLGGLGMGPEGSDVFDEGLLIPPCKLVERGEVNALLLDIVKANSREPVANEGDLYALIACCEAGAARLVAMLEEHALEDLSTLAEHIIDTSRRATLAAIAALPRGTWRHVLPVDGYERELELHATLTIGAERVRVDFTGTSACSSKGINVPLNYAAAYSVFALRCLVGPDIPNNAGSLEPFVVTAPPGCILNAERPAPVAMRHTLGQMTPDLVFGCLHQALPERVPAEGASCMYDLPVRHTPDTLRNGGRVFAIELVHNGGTGARPAADGLSATAYPSGVYGSQVEITEAVAPLVVWRRELLPDSGGAGRFRGGLGQRIEMSSAIDEPFLVFLSVERVKHPARGRAGGLAGAPGRIRVSGRHADIPGKCELRVEPGERLIFDTPGGGGFGEPRQRARERVADDVDRGLVSAHAAHEWYGAGRDDRGDDA